jgi:membrane-associated phospholipid phosphatase
VYLKVASSRNDDLTRSRTSVLLGAQAAIVRTSTQAVTEQGPCAHASGLDRTTRHTRACAGRVHTASLAMSRVRTRLHIGWGSILLLALGVVHSPAEAGAQVQLRPRSETFWASAGVALVGAAFLDEQARTTTLSHRSGVLSSIADAGNQLGTGRNIISGLAITYVGARLLHRRAVADGVLRVAAGYAVSNAIVGVLKPVVGRHRPDSTNDAWRFHPFSAAGSSHSFPSSHAVHAFSLAAGAAIASKRPWVGALAYTEATMVAWSRVYDDQHWTSDVAASAVIGIATAATTLNWLDRRFPPHERAPGAPR